ncbi:MAG: CocE/NonD family hydrolase, partial [Gemmatimonadetes bacterium]|nr:CocE/NonD family hydrolase [Gemmatimonadota bacterium]
PMDEREVEERADVLVFTTPVLEESVEVTGHIKLVLYAASDAPDTDFTAQLVDVHPMGYAQNLTYGIVRASFRESDTDPSPIIPGQVYRYEIDVGVTSNLFHAGHRIRLQVSSSNFPRFDRNQNTGHAYAQDAELAVAQQTIHHGGQQASHLILPVIPDDR